MARTGTRSTAKPGANQAVVKHAGAKAAKGATRGRGVRTLAIDVGGTGLKAALLDAKGQMIGERVRVPTPAPGEPAAIVDALVKLVAPLPDYHRVSIGFPGVVREGVVITAPHFGNNIWHGFPLAKTLSDKLGKPVRLLNDADVQGFGAISGEGFEFVMTLGTGFGTALFYNGQLLPHMEFAHFPTRKKHTLNQWLGNAALKEVGKKKWNHRVAETIEAFRTLLNFDTLYIGGGNAKKLTIELPQDVKVIPNEMGLIGGIRLWGNGVKLPVTGA